MINTQKYRGRITCPHPISQTTCGVLQAVCAGYLNPQKVPACTPEFCWKKKDHCGECRSSVDDPEWDSTCCDNTPGKRLDACGRCGGTGSFDKCDECRQADDPKRDDCKIYNEDGKVIGEKINGLAVSGEVNSDGKFVEKPTQGGGGDVTSVVIFFCIVIVVVVIGAFFYIKQRDEANRRHVESVVASYMPLPDDGGARSPVRSVRRPHATDELASPGRVQTPHACWHCPYGPGMRAGPRCAWHDCCVPLRPPE